MGRTGVDLVGPFFYPRRSMPVNSRFTCLSLNLSGLSYAGWVDRRYPAASSSPRPANASDRMEYDRMEYD
ncbi:MAG: hypothetical protein EBZ36_00460 [Acidobacteria bacterium]|nr:hypothetical protein [Acidobacteriota bacterium]